MNYNLISQITFGMGTKSGASVRCFQMLGISLSSLEEVKEHISSISKINLARLCM